MLDTEQRILVTGPSKKNPMELSGRTENNRVVNFVGQPHMIDQFVDVRITEVLPNSLRGELIREEADMGLRVDTAPETILQRGKVNEPDELGVVKMPPQAS
jgi:tRNA-2-methylthio-N6-dimethylallyladenosine synthase